MFPPTHNNRSFLKLLRSGTDPRLYGGSLYFSYGGDCTLSQQRWVAIRAHVGTQVPPQASRAATLHVGCALVAPPATGAAPGHCWWSLRSTCTEHGKPLAPRQPCCLPFPSSRYEVAAADPAAATCEPWQRAEPAFFWNRSLAAPLLGALRCILNRYGLVRCMSATAPCRREVPSCLDVCKGHA